MRPLFNTVYADEIKISVPHIQSLIESYRERSRTGLIRLAYPREERLHLLFKRGEIVNAFLVGPESWKTLHPDEWLGWMGGMGEAHARLAPLSTFALSLFKILLQSSGSHTEIVVGQSHLKEFLTNSQKRPATALLHLAWDNADGCLFLDGDSLSAYSMFASRDNLVEEPGLAAIFQEWKEPRSVITTCVPDMNSDAWQEYYLRKAFAGTCERALARFEAITGRAMVDSLIRLVAVYASRQNLEITIASRRMVDREVFSSPQQAAQNYRSLIQEFFTHFSSIIGSRLLFAILDDIYSDLNPLEQQAVRQFAILPEGMHYDTK